MATGRISKRSVDALTPGERDQVLWDTDLAGFGVKATPKGRKVYLVQYRLGGRSGRTKRVTLGVHGRVTPDQARNKALSVLGDVARGTDVAVERKRHKLEQRSAQTLVEVSAAFVKMHVRTKLKPRTAGEYERLIDKVILPALGHRLVRDINHKDVVTWQHALRSTPTTANRALAVLRKMMVWAIQHGARPDHRNPAVGVTPYRETKRERDLSAEEFARLGAAIRDGVEEGWLSLHAATAIRLLILLGTRLGEIITLKWEYVDLDRGLLLLPDSKTGTKAVVLNRPAADLLAELPRLDDSPYVIPGELPGKPRNDNLKRPWNRVRKRAGLVDFRLHDVRHSFASLGAGSGLSLPIIGKLLGHRSPQTTARYAHLADDPVRSASEDVALRATAAIGGGGHTK